MSERTIFLCIAAILIIVDLYVSISTFRRKEKHTNYFAGVMLAAALEVILYSATFFTKDLFITKIFLGLFFAAVVVMLYLLMLHMEHYTEMYDEENRLTHALLAFLTAGDVICQFINPFHEIVMHFEYDPSYTMPWLYDPQPLYTIHLLYCYLLMVIVFVRIIQRITRTTSVYRLRYSTVLHGLIIALLINLACVVFQNYGLLDYSQIAYCVMGSILYWDLFYSNQKHMLNSVRQMVVNNLQHPIILFGYNNEVAMCNEASAFLIPNWSPRVKYNLNDFLERNKLNEELLNREEDKHFQWIYESEDKTITYRVEFNVLKDKKGKVIGRMFVFTDTSLGTDFLTGFASKNAFERRFMELDQPLDYPIAVAVCDINGLSLINKKQGNEMGDLCIQHLAGSMVRNCPQDTYFVRLDNADLLAIVPHTTSEQMKNYIKMIQVEVAANNECPFEIQSAVMVVEKEEESILQSVSEATFSMRSRKMMDGTSAHSSLLDSLAQTLLESDDTTKAHVFRTQKLGELMGEHIGLSDLDLSNLSLLCLLHDIGKLGIPLEILNKPGGLSDAEWEVMKSHASKGYRIASASRELEGIADYILHHHEAWDGSGYPDGLKKENIPLLSRIIAIIDSYDAMINDRPYHKALTDAEARNELKRCAGKQFDPYLVSEFLHLLDKMKPLDKEELEAALEQNRTLPQGAFPFSTPVKRTGTIYPIKNSSYKLDRDNYIIEIDDAFTEITGYEKADLEAYHLNQNDLIPIEEREEYKDMVKERLASDGHAYFEHKLRRKDGSTCYVFCFGKPYYDVVNKSNYTEIIIMDIEHTYAVGHMKRQEQRKLKSNMERLEALMRRDSMTGLLNHSSFINDFEAKLLETEDKEMNERLMLTLVDVDNFKEYNDSYGHAAGDELLKRLALALENATIDDGFAGRLGGDEFAVVSAMSKEDSEDASKVREIVNRIFAKVSKELDAIEPSATISMGATIYSEDKNRFRDYYLEADKALYQSKDKGRSSVTILGV